MIRTKGQHELLFDDTQGNERVRIKTKAGHTVDLSDFEKKVTVQSKDGQTIVVDDSARAITLSTNGNTVTIDGSSGTIKLQATSVVIEAASVKLGTAASQSLVMGELFQAFFMSHVHTCNVPSLPSSPPVVPWLPTLLSGITKTG